jgi:hypothetical protein
MKLKLYLDVWQGWDPLNCSAYANPQWDKFLHGKRLSFTVEIPDYLISPEVDLHIQETSIAQEVR